MANEKKMRQIQQTYAAEKGNPGVTLSKLCKDQNIKVSEYADWLESVQIPAIREVQIMEDPVPRQSDVGITIAVDLSLPNGLHLHHDGMSVSELSTLVSKLDGLC